MKEEITTYLFLNGLLDLLEQFFTPILAEMLELLCWI